MNGSDELKAIFNNLTDEQKEMAKECKTEQEFLDLVGKLGVELPDDCVLNVAGGVDSEYSYDYSAGSGHTMKGVSWHGSWWNS